MKQTVAAYIAETLEQAGVKRIWGVTGDSLNGLSDSLNRMGTIDWMPTRHEEVAAFAAGAEAQLTGDDGNRFVSTSATCLPRWDHAPAGLCRAGAARMAGSGRSRTGTRAGRHPSPRGRAV